MAELEELEQRAKACRHAGHAEPQPPAAALAPPLAQGVELLDADELARSDKRLQQARCPHRAPSLPCARLAIRSRRCASCSPTTLTHRMPARGSWPLRSSWSVRGTPSFGRSARHLNWGDDVRGPGHICYRPAEPEAMASDSSQSHRLLAGRRAEAHIDGSVGTSVLYRLSRSCVCRI